MAAVPSPWCTSQSMTAIRGGVATAMRPLPLDHARGDGDVVEDTVAGAVVAEGVMRAAGQVHRGAVGRARGAPRQSFRRRCVASVRPSPPTMEIRSGAAVRASGVPRITSATYVAIVREQRAGRAHGRAARRRSPGSMMPSGNHALAQLSVLRHRERMRVRERQARSDRSRRLSSEWLGARRSAFDQLALTR